MPISAKGVLFVDVQVIELIDSYEFEVIPSRHVQIVTYGCRQCGEFKPVLSEEHEEVRLHAVADLQNIALPAGYARSIRAWSEHGQP